MKTALPRILTINGGSSSIKFGLSKLKKEGYLTFMDLEILEIGLIQGKATTGVTKLLESAISKTGVPVGICSDQGPDVVPAIKLIISN